MDQFLKILQKCTSDVETFDFARRAGQRRKLEESASHQLQSGGTPSTWCPPGVLEQRSSTYCKMAKNISKQYLKCIANFLVQFKCHYDVLFEIFNHATLLSSSTPGGHQVDGVPPE